MYGGAKGAKWGLCSCATGLDPKVVYIFLFWNSIKEELKDTPFLTDLIPFPFISSFRLHNHWAKYPLLSVTSIPYLSSRFRPRGFVSYDKPYIEAGRSFVVLAEDLWQDQKLLVLISHFLEDGQHRVQSCQTRIGTPKGRGFSHGTDQAF